MTPAAAMTATALPCRRRDAAERMPLPHCASRRWCTRRHVAVHSPRMLALALLAALCLLLRRDARGRFVGGGAHAQLGVPSGNLCSALNNCNGHGRCVTASKTCICFEGFGADTDITNYKSPDCSLRVCPSGPSWSGIPTAQDTAHPRAECSDAGFCNRQTGECRCLSGYDGTACQRYGCPNGCSGHGQCVSMAAMAELTNAQPLSGATSYGGAEATTTWDQNRIFGCVCDSSWDVGLGSGQRQIAEWFGPDCSRMRCPSGDDPKTAVDETDCSGKPAPGGVGTGLAGNKCHVDCSNRGKCDYTTGTCACFSGFYGSNCASLSPIV